MCALIAEGSCARRRDEWEDGQWESANWGIRALSRCAREIIGSVQSVIPRGAVSAKAGDHLRV